MSASGVAITVRAGFFNLTLRKNMDFYLFYFLMHWKSHRIRGDKSTIISRGVIMTSTCVDDVLSSSTKCPTTKSFRLQSQTVPVK